MNYIEVDNLFYVEYKSPDCVYVVIISCDN